MSRSYRSQIISFPSSGSQLHCCEPSNPSVPEVGPNRPTARGCPSFFKSMDGLGQREVRPDALPGPMKLCCYVLFISYNRAKVAACGGNPGYSRAQNLGSPPECLTPQREIVAQHDFVAYHTKFVAQCTFVAKCDPRNV